MRAKMLRDPMESETDRQRFSSSSRLFLKERVISVSLARLMASAFSKNITSAYR
jgi:hypothetical protein